MLIIARFVCGSRYHVVGRNLATVGSGGIDLLVPEPCITAPTRRRAQVAVGRDGPGQRWHGPLIDNVIPQLIQGGEKLREIPDLIRDFCTAEVFERYDRRPRARLNLVEQQMPRQGLKLVKQVAEGNIEILKQ